MPNIKMNPPQVYMCSPSRTLLPPPSPYHPSGASQCTSPKHPASCIEPGLATRFLHDIYMFHVSISMWFKNQTHILTLYSSTNTVPECKKKKKEMRQILFIFFVSSSIMIHKAEPHVLKQPTWNGFPPIWSNLIFN